MSTRSKAETLKQVESRLLWLSHWMIHHANNVRENDDGIKVGGHQASSASMVSASSSDGFLNESPVISAPSAADKRLTVG